MTEKLKWKPKLDKSEKGIYLCKTNRGLGWFIYVSDDDFNALFKVFLCKKVVLITGLRMNLGRKWKR